jgi:hypothetical protein
MLGHDTLNPDKREEAITALKDYLRGGGKRKSIMEAQSDMECTELKAELEKLVKSTKPKDQTSLHFKLALYRGLRYSTAGSCYIRSLSYVNELRQFYEGQRLLLTHPQPD